MPKSVFFYFIIVAQNTKVIAKNFKRISELKRILNYLSNPWTQLGNQF